MWRSEWKQVWVGPAKADMAAKVFESIGKFGLALAVAGGVVNSALCNMDAGHWVVIFDGFGGVQDIVIEEGTHFLIPWVQKPIISDCRSRPCNVPVNTGSKDWQNVIITLRILLLPVAGQLPRILPSTGENYDECAARPPLQGSSSPWWLGWRTDHAERAGLQTGERWPHRTSSDLWAHPGWPILDESDLREVHRAVEAKQVAQQQAESARFVEEKAEQQKRKPSSPRRVAPRQRSWSPTRLPPPPQATAWSSCSRGRPRRAWHRSCRARGTSPTCPPGSQGSSRCPSDAHTSWAIWTTAQMFSTTFLLRPQKSLWNFMIGLKWRK